MHAACSGVWGFRASSGVGLADSKGAVAGSLEAVGWACQNPKDLQLVGEALKVPGSELLRPQTCSPKVSSLYPFAYMVWSINYACPDMFDVMVVHKTRKPT